MAASYYRILVDEHGVDAQARCRTWGSGATRVYRSGFDWRYRQSRHIKTISRPILIAVGAAYHNGKDQTIIQRSGNIRSSSRCRSRVLHLVGSCICRFQVTSIGMYLSHLQSQSSPLTARQPTPTGVTSRRTFRVASFHHPFGPHSAACIWTVSDRCAACTCLTFPVSFQPLACSLAPKTPPSYAVIKPNPPNSDSRRSTRNRCLASATMCVCLSNDPWHRNLEG